MPREALFRIGPIFSRQTTASGRGYSTKVSGIHNVYDDVVQILSTSQMTLTPTMALLAPMEELATDIDRTDPRWAAQPEWVRKVDSGPARPPLPVKLRENVRKGVLKLHRAGARLMAGTDAPLTPVGLTLHKELEQAVQAGLTPFEALQMATTVPAELLGQNAHLGSIEVGKLADMAIVDGNPLLDIRNASNVKHVIVNGRSYSAIELPLN